MKQLLLLITLVFASLSHAQNKNGLGDAEVWLEMVDSGKYAESWQQASPFFKGQITEKKWQNALAVVRSPLGAVISRSQPISKQYTNLPGVPQGDYLVIQYTTEFENKKQAAETLTLSKDENKWRPVGYFIN